MTENSNNQIEFDKLFSRLETLDKESKNLERLINEIPSQESFWFKIFLITSLVALIGVLTYLIYKNVKNPADSGTPRVVEKKSSGEYLDEAVKLKGIKPTGISRNYYLPKDEFIKLLECWLKINRYQQDQVFNDILELLLNKGEYLSVTVSQFDYLVNKGCGVEILSAVTVI